MKTEIMNKEICELKNIGDNGFEIELLALGGEFVGLPVFLGQSKESP